jgi:hypothetical protein
MLKKIFCWIIHAVQYVLGDQNATVSSGGDFHSGVLIDAGWFRDRGIIPFSEYPSDNNQVMALPIDKEGYPYLYREYIIKPDDITQRAINKIGMAHDFWKIVQVATNHEGFDFYRMINCIIVPMIQTDAGYSFLLNNEGDVRRLSYTQVVDVISTQPKPRDSVVVFEAGKGYATFSIEELGIGQTDWESAHSSWCDLREKHEDEITEIALPFIRELNDQEMRKLWLLSVKRDMGKLDQSRIYRRVYRSDSGNVALSEEEAESLVDYMVGVVNPIMSQGFKNGTSLTASALNELLQALGVVCDQASLHSSPFA